MKTLGESATLERMGKMVAAKRKNPAVWCVKTATKKPGFILIPWAFGVLTQLFWGIPSLTTKTRLSNFRPSSSGRIVSWASCLR